MLPNIELMGISAAPRATPASNVYAHCMSAALSLQETMRQSTIAQIIVESYNTCYVKHCLRLCAQLLQSVRVLCVHIASTTLSKACEQPR